MKTKLIWILLLLMFVFKQDTLSAFSQSGETEMSEDVTNLKESVKSPLNILTLGDSNGALPDGWATQLKKIRPDDSIFNISISGNTIGFNNLGREALNTLSNIDSFIETAKSKLRKVDEIIIMLGTNDCKAIFRDSLAVVPVNMQRLIKAIRGNSLLKRDKPHIFIVSPPPFGPDELVGEKYLGGLERVVWLNEQLSRVADEANVEFINTFEILLPVFKHLSDDGVHLNGEGQMMIALIIEENLKFLDKR